jgi:predicted component of type VI protein secretion system
MAYLVVKVNSEEVCRQELSNEEPLTIGRALECTLWLGNPKLSRQHCRLLPDDGKWVLVDLSSRNGTYVHGQRIEKHILSDGDTFELDNASITFRDGPFVPRRAAAPPTAAEAAPESVPSDLLESVSSSAHAPAEKTAEKSDSSLFATRAAVTRPGVIRERPHADSTLLGRPAPPLAVTRPPAKPIVDLEPPQDENAQRAAFPAWAWIAVIVVVAAALLALLRWLLM